jgi:hypothetical protein
MTKKLSKKAKSQRSRERALLKKVHLNSAGIDVGADTHWVAVPEDRDERPVRSFGVFTSDLIALCEWLKACQIQTVAMESTGVYWIPLFQMLERNGFEVRLANGCNNSTPSGCCEARFVPRPRCAWYAAIFAFAIL